MKVSLPQKMVNYSLFAKGKFKVFVDGPRGNPIRVSELSKYRWLVSACTKEAALDDMVESWNNQEEVSVCAQEISDAMGDEKL
jgi:hypothetical protein